MVKSSTAQKTIKSLTLALCISLASVGLAQNSLAQTSDNNSADAYAALLQQIENVKVNIAYKETQIGVQEAKMAALQEQITAVEGTKAAIEPMLDKMRVAIKAEMESDLPFNVAERFDRLAGFEEILADKSARVADKWRRALNVYGAEVSYGQTVQAYAGDHPDHAKAGFRLKACEEDSDSSVCGLTDKQAERLEAGEAIASMAPELMDGYYLRYGRLALAYTTADESEVWLYNVADKSWGSITGGRAHDVRRAVKIARGEAAPAVLQAPINMPE